MNRRIGDGASRLETLLGTLEADLLASTADGLRDMLRETGRARDSACREVRSLLDEAAAASEDAPVTPVPPAMAAGSGLLRH